MSVNTRKFTGKAIVIDYAALLDYDDTETIGICLNQRQVAIIKALLIPAYWSTRWDNLTLTPGELHELIAAIENQLDGNDCGVESMLFRDNPTDPCEVQYSTNDGATWSTMFRKDNCAPGSTETTIQNWYDDETLVNNTYTTYAGDILNVASDWVYVDADSEAALCWSVQFWVDMLCEQAIAQIQSDNQSRRDANDWLDDLAPIVSGLVVGWLASMASGVITFPVVVTGALVYGLTLTIDNFLDALVTKNYSDFEDEDAKDVVKCYMYQEITGSTPQWAAWSGSLSDYESFGGAAKTIAEFVDVANNNVRAYIEWMILTEDINSISDTLPPCPCPSTWTHTWNFATHGADTWVIDKIATPAAWGTWQEGDGFLCEEHVTGGSDRNSCNFIYFPEATPNVTTMTITYDCLRGDWDGIPTAREFGFIGLGVRSDNSGVIMDGDDQEVSYVRAVGDGTGAYVFLKVSDHAVPTADYGYGLVTKIVFEGEGIDPFYGRETS